MPNLPYLVTVAQQCLRGGDKWPLTIYERGHVYGQIGDTPWV